MKYLLDILFPKTCRICKKSIEDNQSICSECLNRLDRSEQALNRDNETEKFFVSKRHFSYGGCWLNYRKGSYLQALIHQAKFGNGDPVLWEQFGQQAAREWEDTGFFDNVDIIVPIPLHQKRLRERGFNQSEYICRGLCSVLNVPMDTDHLTRVRATKHQSLSTMNERQVGINNAFAINHPEEWYRKTIMLVDDIITTGATIRAAMDAMNDVYGCKIVVFGVAKTK